MASLHPVKTDAFKNDAVREREMLRYFQPESAVEDSSTRPYPAERDNTLCVSKASSPDTALTAYAQLCAIRLQAQRAMISLIGAQTQYFIAEATQTLNLADTSKSEKKGDELWVGCAAVDKSGRLCEHTLQATPNRERFPMFTVTNLLEDSRFNELPFVKDEPFFKFYAGTPITTKRGINIGSLFILDNIERPPLTADQVDHLGTLAQTIMDHMEATAEAKEKRKITKLSTGMNAFVEGRSHLDMEQMHDAVGARWATSEGTSKTAARRASTMTTSSYRAETSIPSSRKPDKPTTLRKDESISDNSHEDSDHENDVQHSLDTSHRSTLARASNILYQSLELKGHGGVVFFDSTTKRHHRANAPSHSNQRDRNGLNGTVAPPPAEVIASTTAEPSVSMASCNIQPQDYSSVDDEMLHSLLRRYPKGHMWTLEDNITTSSEDDTPRVINEDGQENTRPLTNRKRTERSVLKQHFPGATQLLFYGLWDAGSSRWFTACCVWTTSHRPLFTVEIELNYLMSFGNSVMAQVSRLASMAADRQKADFIGSISHELRSPLHGILASAEFLSEVCEDTFQHSLIDTVSSCGRTLLDTINHILDYSKINSFERTWRNSKTPRGKYKAVARGHRTNPNKETPPMLSIHATVDVASLVEEVVEGVCAGQVYQDISSTDAASFSDAGKAEASARGINFSANSGRKTLKKEVDVILDITHDNYMCTSQPGALKRLVMNIFGNALKYTQKGTIKVELSLDATEHMASDQVPMVDPQRERTLQIRIIDTGKGISREYLRTSLYNPFCQEDVLASGTGLGLSIVRSIVTMLQGAIDIQSEVGVGTEVTMRLPLAQFSGPESTQSTPSSNGSLSMDDSMNVLKRDHAGGTVALFGFEENKSGLTPVLQRYIEDWFGLQAVKYPKYSSTIMSDVVLVEEKALLNLLSKSPTHIPIVVLCDNTTRNQIASRAYSSAVMEFISKPCGLHKLARALKVCLDKARNNTNGLLTSSSMSASASDEVTPTQQIDRLVLETTNGDGPMGVQSNEQVAANASSNALMAVENSSPKLASENPKMKNATEFPFPQPPNENENPPSPQLSAGASERPKPVARSSEPLSTQILATPSKQTNVNMEVDVDASRNASLLPPGNMSEAKTELLGHKQTLDLSVNDQSHPPIPPEPIKRPPKLLLVDDNKINLRLLETCMKKRKYQDIDTAEDGLMAVQAAEDTEDGYDIIFMDISMPVMNGFEATRAIRDLERRRSRHENEEEQRRSALIIALTGLASSQDQAEAFASGVDLFLTKPVSFKEVGKLLDNWEAHGGLRNESGRRGSDVE